MKRPAGSPRRAALSNRKEGTRPKPTALRLSVHQLKRGLLVRCPPQSPTADGAMSGLTSRCGSPEKPRRNLPRKRIPTARMSSTTEGQRRSIFPRDRKGRHSRPHGSGGNVWPTIRAAALNEARSALLIAVHPSGNGGVGEAAEAAYGAMAQSRVTPPAPATARQKKSAPLRHSLPRRRGAEGVAVP